MTNLDEALAKQTRSLEFVEKYGFKANEVKLPEQLRFVAGNLKSGGELRSKVEH